MSSKEVDKVIPAMSDAQEKYPKIEKTKEGHYGKFANMLDIMEGVRQPNRECGLIIYHVLLTEDGSLYSESRLCHWDSQQYVSSRMPLDKELSAQAMGSAITYAQKYCTKALLGIQADEDTDGQEAEDEQRARRAPKAAPKAKPPKKPATKEAKEDEQNTRLGIWWASIQYVMTQGGEITDPKVQKKTLRAMVNALGYESTKELSVTERNELLAEVNRLYGPLGESEHTRPMGVA